MIHKRSGFTLVETLVVIAAIATLAAISFSGWQSLITRGKATQCLNNLRTIGLASMAYAADHDMTLPVTVHQRRKGLQSWTLSLQEYSTTKLCFKCPCDEVKERQFTYCINDFLTPNPSGAALLNFSHLNRLDSPARTILFAEASKGYLNSDHFHFADYVGLGLPSDLFADQVGVERHLGGANYLFADGHVESLKWSAVKEILSTPQNVFVDPTGNYIDTQNQ
jgi:prepilin-type processing-associated H-X9-DG protein/prepilin-type N-terminal cleavage/methylation domain-containing protein